MSKTGKETVLHSFDWSDGASPDYGSLLMDKKDNLYGVTEEGGTSGEGVVFKLSKKGKLTVLHSFGGTGDGCVPDGTPVMDKRGNLYGTTIKCGSSNAGIVWKLSTMGKETVLHNFAGGASDGAEPVAGLIIDGEGNLYGDTYGRGASGLGTVFKLNKKGTLTLLHGFTASDGGYPYDDLIREAKGALYGTTLNGGGGYGTVWKLTP